MISKEVVLKIAEGKQGVLIYKDFKILKPAHPGDHWLFRIKQILEDNGYICHIRKRRKYWGNCGYFGSYTHFHKPGTLAT